ncbi:MAG: prephenate dehydrogenase/arogenate dehydrogenase family protein [Chloroflexi bacterium]|nr:prephenate dehydrogenase/arogenate dehydrogenase family protein [Chloroflexota bacterium]
MRVAILGLGLIGGSIAQALHGKPGWDVAAWTPAGRGPAAAVRAGTIGHAPSSPEAAVEGAQLVVLAAPPAACLDLLDELAGPLRTTLAPAAVITDVASTKTAIVLRAMALGLRFVGGHPMAGRETTGYEAASGDLFVGRPWVVIPAGDLEATSLVIELVRACGAHPVEMSAAAHDDAVAAISHLPLIVAASLVESVAGGPAGPRADWAVAEALAASGWRDATRLARGDVVMGGGIALTNSLPIAARIRALVQTLEDWLTVLEAPGGPDPELVGERLRNARDRLLAMS